jgi:hypothetical protein
MACRATQGVRRWGFGLALSLVATGMAVAPVTAGAEPGFGSAVALHAPSGLPVGATPYDALSCPAPGTCTAVGIFANPASTSGETLYATSESDGSWSSPVIIGLPANQDLSDVDVFQMGHLQLSCASVGNCVTVGTYVASPPNLLLAEEPNALFAATETDGTWGAAVEISMPDSTPVDSASWPDAPALTCLPDASCVLAGAQVIVSFLSSAETYVPFGATETDGTWSATTIGPTPTILGTGELWTLPTAISCTDVSDCTLIDTVEIVDSDSLAGVATYLTSETSGVWGTPAQLDGPNGDPWTAESLACANATSCVLFGEFATSLAGFYENEVKPAVDVESGGVWQEPSVLALPALSPAISYADFESVSCDATFTCVAVATGITSLGFAGAAIAVTYADGSWSSINEQSTGVPVQREPATSIHAASVSCPSATRCWEILEASAGQPDIGETSDTVSFFEPVTPHEAVVAPGAPRDVHVIPINRIAEVSWQPPLADGGATISSYRVSAASADHVTLHCTAAKHMCRITGLGKGQWYRVSVQAVNKAGSSKPSPATRFRAHYCLECR